MRALAFMGRCALLASLSLAFAAPTMAEDSFTMGAAVEKALRDNPGITAARAGHDAAEEGRKSARGAFGPALSSTYGYTRYDHKPVSMGIARDDDLYAWTLRAKQNIFTGFNLLSTYQKAALEKDRQEAVVRNTELGLIATVQENFLGYLKARENVRSANDALERLKSQRKVTQAYYDVGLRPRLDVLQAEVDLSRAESDLILAENTEATQQARLNTLLALDLSAPVVYAGSLEYLPFDMTLEECLERAYRQRPDITIAARAIDIARKDKTIVESQYYPQIAAQMDWSKQGDHPNVDGSEISPSGFSQWSVGATASWTAFEWGRTYYAAEQAGQLVNKVRAEDANLRQEVAFEVKSRLLKVQEAAKRIGVARKGLDQAGEAYRMALARYEAQVGTNTDVLDALAKFTAAEATLTTARTDYLTALSKLMVSLGERKTELALH